MNSVPCKNKPIKPLLSSSDLHVFDYSFLASSFSLPQSSLHRKVRIIFLKLNITLVLTSDCLRILGAYKIKSKHLILNFANPSSVILLYWPIYSLCLAIWCPSVSQDAALLISSTSTTLIQAITISSLRCNASPKLLSLTLPCPHYSRYLHDSQNDLPKANHAILLKSLQWLLIVFGIKS